MPDKDTYCQAEHRFNGIEAGEGFVATRANAEKWEGMKACKIITEDEYKALAAPPERKDIQAPPEAKAAEGDAGDKEPEKVDKKAKKGDK